MGIQTGDTILRGRVDRLPGILRQPSLLDIHPQDLVLIHGLADFRRHRAEILADQHALVPVALQAQHRKELIHGIAHIGPLLRAQFARHPVEPVEGHDMVQPQHPRIPHVVFQALPDIPVAVFPNPRWMQR